MRLWHSALIPVLDNKRLSDLHMSCCNLRGLGWGKRNKNIDYIYSDPLGEEALAWYHQDVLIEMSKRGYNFERKWLNLDYCGKRRQARVVDQEKLNKVVGRNIALKAHDLEFFLKDVEALQQRGVDVAIVERGLMEGHAYVEISYTRSSKKETIYGRRVIIGGTKDE